MYASRAGSSQAGGKCARERQSNLASYARVCLKSSSGMSERAQFKKPICSPFAFGIVKHGYMYRSTIYKKTVLEGAA